MSTTLDRDVAMGYAAGDGSRMGLVLEVRQGAAAGQKSPPRDQELRLAWWRSSDCRLGVPAPNLRFTCHFTPPGMVNRGANISWLSQYTHEAETLFGPLTGIEVLDTRIDGSVVEIICDFSINLTALTLEQVLGKRRTLIDQMAEQQVEVVRRRLEVRRAPLQLLSSCYSPLTFCYTFLPFDTTPCRCTVWRRRALRGSGRRWRRRERTTPSGTMTTPTSCWPSRACSAPSGWRSGS